MNVISVEGMLPMCQFVSRVDFNLFAMDSLCCCVDKRAIDAVQATSFCHTLASSLDPTDASNLGARPKMITSGSHGDLPRGFLNHVDEEGGVWVVLQLLEVPKHFVVGCGAKYSLEMQIHKELFVTSFYPRTLRREENSASM